MTTLTTSSTWMYVQEDHNEASCGLEPARLMWFVFKQGQVTLKKKSKRPHYNMLILKLQTHTQSQWLSSGACWGVISTHFQIRALSEFTSRLARVYFGSKVLERRETTGDGIQSNPVLCKDSPARRWKVQNASRRICDPAISHHNDLIPHLCNRTQQSPLQTIPVIKLAWIAELHKSKTREWNTWKHHVKACLQEGSL